MNFYAIRAIYLFELARTWRTLLQSIATPVISTSLYFVVFGSAIGARMEAMHGIPYGAFIIPGLIMMALLTESISNASFGIYMPRYSGTIYEVLSAPVSYVEIVIGYVGAAATKSLVLGVIILVTARLFVDYEIQHPLMMALFLVLTAVTMALEAGVPTKTHILNLLYRLVDGKPISTPPVTAPQALKLVSEPMANVERYDDLRKEKRHAS